MNDRTIAWQWVTPLEDPVPQYIRDHLRWLDDLREQWQEAVNNASEAEFKAARERRLRRHAIETGIIERLYEADWGVTEALVAEGVTAEVAARHGGLDDEALRIISTQLNALEWLAGVATDRRQLSVGLIRQLHQAITRAQHTYEAIDTLGRPALAVLHQGQWKTQANHVRRPDGVLLQYTPPEHVPAEMDRLVNLYQEMAGEHALIRAAWLHHRFVRVHPFEDGNGRVARALTLLVLLQERYAPLVVDRRQRDTYIRALDAANQGDLNPLIGLFARLESDALRSEMGPAAAFAQAATVAQIARAHADRLVSLRRTAKIELAERTAALAVAVHDHLQQVFVVQCEQLRQAFLEADPDVDAFTTTGWPGKPNAHYWRRQLIRAANAVDFFTNLAEGCWWVQLKLRVLDQSLRYVAAVQKVGRGETGTLALTAFAGLLPTEEEKDAAGNGLEPTEAFELSPADSVTFILSDIGQLERRWPEVDEFIERTLAAAVDKLGRGLSG